jgi:hypothetical protein
VQKGAFGRLIAVQAVAAAVTALAGGCLQQQQQASTAATVAHGHSDNTLAAAPAAGAAAAMHWDAQELLALPGSSVAAVLQHSAACRHCCRAGVWQALAATAAGQLVAAA